ncbi:MAG: GIY-YIG nuclease family protein [Ignavibacteria bacterium]|nr:GIY-YIG nuclease family protein [Ignavibacteria bacterium]
MNSFESILDFLISKKKPESFCRYYIYFIECNGRYKIGSTSDMKSRFTALQTSNPSQIHVAHVIPIPFTYSHSQIEKSLHVIFGNYKVRGEWYNLTQVDIERIKAVSIDVILQIAEKMTRLEEIKNSNQLAFDFIQEK